MASFWRKAPGAVDASAKPASDASSDRGALGAHEADDALHPGRLTLEEEASGGLGRHLGLFSTTFLM